MDTDNLLPDETNEEKVDTSIIPVPEKYEVVKRDRIDNEELLVKNNSFLTCDFCYIKDKCPEFKEHNECAFNITLKPDSANLAKDIIMDIISIQYGRVVRGKMIEEADGGLPDKALSNEIALLMNLIEQAKGIGEEKNTIKIEAKGKDATGSIISKIFGDIMTQKNE